MKKAQPDYFQSLEAIVAGCILQLIFFLVFVIGVYQSKIKKLILFILGGLVIVVWFIWFIAAIIFIVERDDFAKTDDCQG